MDIQRRTCLARAHTVLAVVTAMLVAVAMLLPSGASRWPKPELQGPNLALKLAALAYLVLSSLSQWRRAAAWASLDQNAPRPGLPALLGHLWVFIVAGAAVWRGANSRTLLAGGDPVLAALITASGLALTLLLVEWWLRSTGRHRGDPMREVHGADYISWLTGIAGWLVVLAMWFIESVHLASR